MRAANKLDRAGCAAHWMAVVVSAAVAAGLMGCVTTPVYPGYGAGHEVGHVAGSNAYGNSIAPTTYSSGYGSYDASVPQPYPQQPLPTYSQLQPTYSQPSYSPYSNNGDPSYQVLVDNRYGVVEYVEAVSVHGQLSGVGAVLDGVVGGLLGHQAGGRRGNTIATIGGVVADAMVGNVVEGNTVVGQTYRVIVRLNDNSRITLAQNNSNGLHVGDRARIENSTAVSYQPLPAWECPCRFQERRGPTDIAEAITPR